MPGKPHYHLYLFIKAAMCLKVIKTLFFLFLSEVRDTFSSSLAIIPQIGVSCYTLCFSTGFISLLSMFCVYKGPYARVQEGVETHRYSYLENPTGRGDWQATVQRVVKS